MSAILAYSFQTGLTYADAVKLLGADGSGSARFGEWYERDSAWYSELLSCRSYRGMWLNLYFFDEETILELKFDGSESGKAAAESVALKELLPALGARDIKPTGSVN